MLFIANAQVPDDENVDVDSMTEAEYKNYIDQQSRMEEQSEATSQAQNDTNSASVIAQEDPKQNSSTNLSQSNELPWSQSIGSEVHEEAYEKAAANTSSNETDNNKAVNSSLSQSDHNSTNATQSLK